MTKSRLPPIGFWSYVRRDDELSRQRISELREFILCELGSQLGQEVPVFKDTVSILPGARWAEQTAHALSDATFLVPVLTPRFLQSEWCCREVRLFLEREKRLRETYPDLPAVSRIFPIHYIDVTDADARDEEIRDTLMELQHLNFDGMRHRACDDLIVQTAVAAFVKAICNILRLRVEVPDGPLPGVEKTGPSTTPARKARQPRPRPDDHGLDVILIDRGLNRLIMAKEVQAIAGVTVREAMAIVDGLPWPVARGVSIDKAMTIMARIEAQGGTVELQARTTPAEDDPRPMAPTPEVKPEPVGPPPPPPSGSAKRVALGTFAAIAALLVILAVANWSAVHNEDVNTSLANASADNNALDMTYEANAMDNAADAAMNAADAAANTVAPVETTPRGNLLVTNNCNTHLDLFLTFRQADSLWEDGVNWGIDAGQSQVEYETINHVDVPIHVGSGEFFYYARSPDGSTQIRGDVMHAFAGARGGTFPSRHVFLSPSSSGQYAIDLTC